ncbi:hypothetical protein H7I53_25645 [Mycolicibacterium pulveris]|uniref:Dopamine receptor D4 n=1 Tax=Mycolicibacterium pulveris TaxID=36813 RepID=A0A7I7US91_MYCPV|nr:hypothetical protein [Mycolicibacterium pulveris]MCV6983589.1 hypothetical protein [Mycolicibacterium pulveris]BBY83469.1 hypothetical protein MPUL_46270 [Mycolicibacterium pulveris]
MTQRRRAVPSATAVRLAAASALIVGGAMAAAGQAGADPVPTPTPGQPVVDTSHEPTGPQPPPPVGAPPVPEIAPVYGQGQSQGQFGFLRDMWHMFHSGNPLAELTAPPPVAAGPPPGAGPAPPLPPGHISLTAPESSTPPASPPGAAPEAVPAPPIEHLPPTP